MNTLQRTAFRRDGIDGVFTFDGEDAAFMETLEHAYPEGEGTYAPIIPEGVYTCVRGVHQLEHGPPFETFEITGVEGHSGLLFHVGNFNDDSRGCVLCGTDLAEGPNDTLILTGSRAKFTLFMGKLAGVDQFQLQVLD